MKPQQHLEARYIYEEAQAADWQEGRNYWSYPIYAPDGTVLAYRKKKYPDSPIEGYKYLWEGEKPTGTNAEWYILPETVAAIKAAGGVAYLANGEPALLAYHAGGIHNVIATTLSEVAVPSNILSYLRGIGVSRLLYPVDNDKAGFKSAINWRDALAGSGIDFAPLAWPMSAPEKADANDILIHVKGDKTGFQNVVYNETLALELPLPEIHNKPVLLGEFNKSGLVSAAHNALQNGGYTRRKVRKGVWLECLCPFHDDKQPSAGFNIESGVLNCMGSCGKAYSPEKVAEHFGIRWQDFYPQREKAQGKPKKAVSHIHEYAKEDKPLDLSTESLVEAPVKQIHVNTAWIEQDDLPASWIYALLALCHAKSMSPIYAIRLHHAIRNGELDGQRMSLKDIMTALGDAPRLSSQAFVNFLLELNFLWILHTNLLEEGLDTKSINKSAKAGQVSAKRGRPETYYAINTHTDSLTIALAECLEPLLIERLSEDLELAPRSHTMRDSLDLSLEAYKEWHARTNNPKLEYILKQVSEIISDLLTNTVSIAFTEAELEHPSNLRAKLLNLELAPHSDRTIIDSTGKEVFIPRTGIQLSKAKLALILGCSQSSLSNLYKQANVGSQRVRGWHMVTNPNGTDIEKELREAPVNFNKALGGSFIGMYMKVWEYGKSKNTTLLYHYEMDKIRDTFARWDGKIQTLYIWIEQPSLLWNMNAEEIALKQSNLTVKTELAADTTEAITLPETEGEKVIATPEPKPRKKATIAGKDRAWKGHSAEWLRAQLEKEVKRDTPYVLKNSAICSEETGEIIHSVKALREVVIWLNDYAAKAKEVAKSIEAPKTDHSVDFTPKTMPEKTIVSLVAKPMPAPETEFDGWIHHQEEFERRMASL